jgi:hypothetical protein
MIEEIKEVKISLIHPSRNRAIIANNAYNNWLEKSSGKINIQYILSVDNDDDEIENYANILHKRNKFFIQQLCISSNKNAIEAINVAAKLSKGNIIIVMSDDFDCEQNWDEKICQLLDEKIFYCAKTKDGIQEHIITLPIIDRAFYNHFGYVYNPIYQHMYCDTEMSCVAYLMGAYIDLKNQITFNHKHYSIGASEKDKINEKNDLTYLTGKPIFIERLKNNFDIKNAKSSIPQDFVNTLW